jgi:hypothetical protein
MSRFGRVISVASLLGVAFGPTGLYAERQAATLAVTMTNETSGPAFNQIKVYDASDHTLLQTLSTHGQGGVGGNARGIKQYNGDLLAVVNNGSNSVAIFRRQQDGLAFDRVVSTTSAPVSVDFGNDHMYVAGATTVDSFVLHGNSVGWLDGTAYLTLADGTAPPNGSTAQVGVVNDRQLLVTLKADPAPGTVDIVQLDRGAVGAAPPTAVSAPTGTLTPFGFSVSTDGTAIITLAHSSQDGLFRNGAFTAVIAAGQSAPCWMTQAGKYLFTANTGSKTISRLIGTGNNLFVDSVVAATIPTGGAPSDIDTNGGVLGVIDHAGGQSHLSVFTYNVFGELTASGSAINLGVANANGVAIMAPARADGN